MANRLAQSTSLYLRQHSDNPVDWWPWSNDALEEAKRLDKPIFISIGYSSCHWCHVMAHESFEDESIAKIMNQNFICIKVDREEHPDVDATYMNALLTMADHGGWPLNLFCTPDGKPFFGGTYFPPREGGHIPSFERVLQTMAHLFYESRAEVEENASNVATALKERNVLAPTSGLDIDTDALSSAFAAGYGKRYDKEWGGVGRAPKFLQPHLIKAIYEIADLSDDTNIYNQLVEAANHTLRLAASGGMFDHVGGGFARYSTDAFWMVPHFEKMLYDQALNVRAYLRGFFISKDADFEYIIRKTCDFVLDEMTLEDGLFTSSYDADSDGEEGAYYIFRIEEIREALGGEDPELERQLGITKAGNFEGRNIIHRPNATSIKGDQKLQDGLAKLALLRSKRNSPARDDKAIVEWNSMMTVALLEAGFALNEPRYTEAAERCLTALSKKAQIFGEGTRIAGADPTNVPATLVDYANFIEAYLTCYLIGSEVKDPSMIVQLLEKMMDSFYDSESANFSLGAKGQSGLFMRSSDHLDGAYASASATAISTLLFASHVLGEDRYQQLALEALAPLAPLIQRNPEHFAPLASLVLGLANEPSEIVVTTYDGELVDLLRGYFSARTMVAIGDHKVGPLFSYREPNLAYVCVNYACQLPNSDVEALRAELNQREAERRDG